MRSVAAGKPILVVEDEHNIASLVKLYLSNEGFSVAWVADGAKALDEADRLQPALVILDLMLPGLDGLEICRRLPLELGESLLLGVLPHEAEGDQSGAGDRERGGEAERRGQASREAPAPHQGRIRLLPCSRRREAS